MPRSLDRSCFWIVLVLVGCLGGIVHGDEFELDDGSRLEGSVVRELGDLVIIRTTEGKIVTIEKGRIKYRRKKETIYDQYRRKSAEIEKGTAAQHYALARWCETQKLEAEATRHLKETIRLDPNHEAARRELGYVLIAGDWYLEGSPQAKARREEIERPLPQKPKEVPKDYKPPPKPQPRVDFPDLVPRRDFEPVQYRFDERVNKQTPEVSMTYYRVRDFFHSLKKPLHFVSSKPEAPLADGYLLEVKVRVFFVRVHTFYTKPISNIFRGEAEAYFYRIQDGKKEVLSQIKRLEVPFSASIQLDKEEAYQFAYFDTVQMLVAKLSRRDYFKDRGAKPIPIEE